MRRRVPFLLLMTFVLSAGVATAEPLRVTSGAFFLDIEGDMFTFTGEGFSITTEGPEPFTTAHPDGLFIYSTKQFTGEQIGTEGSLVDWSFETIGGEQLLGKGTATIDGVSATNLDFVGSMRFDAVPTQFSPGGTTDFDFVGPFSFEAMIRGIRDGEELFARRFVGSGQVTVNYEEGINGPGIFTSDDDRIPYAFEDPAPIPEPATLLLLGSGLSAALLRRRRRRAIDPS